MARAKRGEHQESGPEVGGCYFRGVGESPLRGQGLRRWGLDSETWAGGSQWDQRVQRLHRAPQGTKPLPHLGKGLCALELLEHPGDLAPSPLLCTGVGEGEGEGEVGPNLEKTGPSAQNKNKYSKDTSS